MIGVLVACGALAAPEAGLSGIEVTPEGFRASYDATLFVRRDGNLYLEDRLLMDLDLTREIVRLQSERGPDLRLVISADAAAPYARVVQVLDMAQAAGAKRVALEIGTAAPPVDPLFPGAAPDGVVNLDEAEYTEAFSDYRPRRHKFPQNPYGSTDFTAYAREWGEMRVGLAAISYGILPRVQIGTAPALDAVGIYNVQAKGNFLRAGPWDAAISGSLFVVPITNLLQAFDSDGKYNIAGYKVNDEQIFVDRVTYLGLTLQNSLQIVGGWSLHGGVGYARASAKGNLDFQNLPVIALPGLDPIGGDLTLVPSVVGEVLEVRLATDYRFNRRDSLIIQSAATVYGAARGAISGDIRGLPAEVQNFDFQIGYNQLIPASLSYRASLAYQLSWRRVDLRLGVGYSAVPWTWLLQAFDLSYRFGGETRRTETVIRKGYRDDKKELDILDEIDFQMPPPPEPE